MVGSQQLTEAQSGERGVVSLEGVRNLIFDLDGTLVDSVPGISESLAEAFHSVGRTLSADRLKSVIGPPIRVIARRLDPSLTDEELAGIEARYRHRYDNEGWRRTVVFPGVAEILHTMHADGFQLFIVTNKPAIPTKRILQELKLESCFVEMLSRDTRSPAYAHKAEMIGDLLRRHELRPHESAMIGDTQEDGEAAGAQGIVFVAASYGYGEQVAAPYSLAQFSDIAGLFAWNRATKSLLKSGYQEFE